MKALGSRELSLAKYRDCADITPQFVAGYQDLEFHDRQTSLGGLYLQSSVRKGDAGNPAPLYRLQAGKFSHA